MDNPGLESRAVLQIFLLSLKFRQTVGPLLSPIHMELWLFFGVKRPGCKVDCLLPSSAEFENEWHYSLFPPICLHEVDKEKNHIYLHGVIAEDLLFISAINVIIQHNSNKTLFINLLFSKNTRKITLTSTKVLVMCSYISIHTKC